MQDNSMLDLNFWDCWKISYSCGMELFSMLG